ncbi:ABC transporter [Arthrobacter sp. UYCu712]|uniref:ABC transporter n=1 Tax=Arthrobacter sp. UYCu712 TaxID=3156340 RepID=UPI00339B057B
MAEVAEPQLHLVAIDAEGEASMLDLLTGTDSRLGKVGPPADVTTDGRYVFAANSTGVEIVDSGVWTWDHVDHFHYYRAEPKTVGTLAGEGTATIATGMLSTAGTTGVFFPSSGAAVLLDNSALSDGTISESLRLDVEPHDGMIAPLGEGAMVTEADAGGKAARLRAIDATGSELTSTECPGAAGTITTRVGLVIGCADGAVIATTDGNTPVLEHVPYPAGAAAPATAFEGRKGRPTVAGLGTDAGVWLLNTRQRTWDWLPTSTQVLAAAAVDDAEGRVVAVGADGTVQVYDATTKQRIAATEPLMAATLADPALAGKVELSVDGQRAYLSAPAEGVVYEIDYADGARIARTLELPTRPVHLAETGR